MKKVLCESCGVCGVCEVCEVNDEVFIVYIH